MRTVILLILFILTGEYTVSGRPGDTIDLSFQGSLRHVIENNLSIKNALLSNEISELDGGWSRVSVCRN